MVKAHCVVITAQVDIVLMREATLTLHRECGISYVLIIVVFLCNDHLVTLHHSAVDWHVYINMCYIS